LLTHFKIGSQVGAFVGGGGGVGGGVGPLVWHSNPFLCPQNVVSQKLRHDMTSRSIFKQISSIRAGTSSHLQVSSGRGMFACVLPFIDSATMILIVS